MRDKIMDWWKYVQDLLSVDGGLYVDWMCLVMIVRLGAVLFHFPPMNMAEAGIWAATISTYGYSNNGPKGGQS